MCYLDKLLTFGAGRSGFQRAPGATHSEAVCAKLRKTPLPPLNGEMRPRAGNEIVLSDKMTVIELNKSND